MSQRNVTVYLPEHWVVDEPSVESLRAGMDLPVSLSRAHRTPTWSPGLDRTYH